MLDAILRWRSKWRKLAAHLEENGVRVPATVVDIAGSGSNHEYESDASIENELIRKMPGETLAPSNTGNWYVRKTILKIRPADEPEFEMEGKIRYGDWGLDIPKPGAEIAVVYDPNDHSKVMVAPPTAEEEALRTAQALGKAKIGFTVGGGGGAKPGTGEPPSEEQLAASQNQMDQAQSMLEQAQQFMSGQVKPGEMPQQAKDEDSDSEK